MRSEITVTKAGKALIDELKAIHGDLMFYMSGGCCEGSQPMCFIKAEYLTGINDRLKGTVENCEFYLSREQDEYYQYSEIILDATQGMGGGFSLESPLGKMFITRSKLLQQKKTS